VGTVTRATGLLCNDFYAYSLNNTSKNPDLCPLACQGLVRVLGHAPAGRSVARDRIQDIQAMLLRRSDKNDIGSNGGYGFVGIYRTAVDHLALLQGIAIKKTNPFRLPDLGVAE
jgi:hypothetical protein